MRWSVLANTALDPSFRGRFWAELGLFYPRMLNHSAMGEGDGMNFAFKMVYFVFKLMSFAR